MPVAAGAAPLQPAQWSELNGWRQDDPAEAWPALLASCSKLVVRSAWAASCTAATALGAHPDSASARSFFEQRFRPWRLVNPDGSRQGLITGYYEPLIKGSRTPSARYAWPIRGVPADLLSIELGDVYPQLKGQRLRGRLDGARVVPYWTRAEIEARARRGELKAPVLFWAEDPVELFFLQVQGSGRVELPDSSLARIGFADQNGQPYRSIGRWLVEHGELSLSQASMAGIKAWVRTHPQRLDALLNENPRYVFFREVPHGDGGPVGSLGVPIAPGRSLAVDARYVPLGAPVFLHTTAPLSDTPLDRLMLAQDSGAAIQGVVRADFFWGFGAAAGQQAGRMRQQGEMWVLLPRDMQPPR